MATTRAGPLRFIGSSISTAAAFSIGHATAPAVRPFLQELTNLTWSVHPVRPPDAGTLAVGVAQGQVDPGDAAVWAAQQGIGAAQFKALVDIARVGPGVAEAFRLWRRKELDEDGFRRALKRTGIEAEWIEALWKVREDILDPADLARAIHKGLIDDQGLLQGHLPSGEGNVPAYPVYPIDAILEALGSGIDRDRLGVMVGLQGNPMGAHEAAGAQFRGILTYNDYLRAIAEGNTRNEWAKAIYEQSRQIPTAREFLENALRGYRDLPSALAGAALHGMSPEHATMVYQNQGRPMIPRQITQALAWGAHFHPEAGELTDPYEASTVEGSVKPAYYELYKSLRYSLPSAFYFRLLQTGGTISVAQAKVWYRRLGWPPELADQVAEAFGKGTGAVGATETKAELADEYITGFLSEGEYRDHLATLGFIGAEQDLEVLHAEVAAIKAARGAAVTKVRNLYEKGDITADHFRNALGKLGMHEIAIRREVEYANVVLDPSA